MAALRGRWSAVPDAGPPDGILFIELFGRLSGVDHRSATLEGALWAVFRTRAEMLGWERDDREAGVRWSTHEAELTIEERTSRVGWTQVGVDSGSSPVPAIPALVQCFEDALARFGRLETAALQLSASHLQYAGDRSDALLAAWLAWFDASPGPSVEAVLAFDDRMLRGHEEPVLLHRLSDAGSPFFSVGPWLPLTPEQRIEEPPEAPLDGPLAPALRGFSVRLPEWSAPAIAWIVAAVADAALAGSPSPSPFAVRLTRLDDV